MAMTRDEFEALYASIPADKLRTIDDDIILSRSCPTPEKRKEDAIWSLEHCMAEVRPVFQLMLDEQTFTAEDWEKLYNVLDLLVAWEE